MRDGIKAALVGLIGGEMGEAWYRDSTETEDLANLAADEDRMQ